jgi:sugar (pentulose or hexulose) kinase
LDPVVVAGGVSKNRKVLQYPQEAVKRPLRALPDGEYIGVIGAALIALKRQKTGQAPADIRSFPSFSGRPAIRIPSSPEPVLHPFDPFAAEIS